jgi:prevent-host-death family protein
VRERHRQLQEVKSRFSDVVRAAERGEVTIVPRRGVETAVVMSVAAYREIVRPPMSILATLRGAPTIDPLPVERHDDPGRTLDLESRFAASSWTRT